MADPTFAPPAQPDYVVPLAYEVSTVRTPVVSGRHQARARWSQPLRRFKLRWEDADFATVRYLVGFFAAMQGPATLFRYLLPAEELYWPEYPIPVTTSTTAGGALGNRTYYVAFAWANANGETRVGPIKAVALLNGELITVTVPEFPRGATSAKVFVNTTASVTLEATITTSRGSWTEPASGLVGGGASPVTTSTFQENLRCAFGQETFEPQHQAGQLATCELMIEEVSEA